MDYIESKYFSYADPEDPVLKKILIRSIEFISGQPTIFKLYRKYQESPEKWKSFWAVSYTHLTLPTMFEV